MKVLEKMKSNIFKQTARTAAAIIVMLLIYLGLNKLVELKEPTPADLTAEKTYSLTDESKEAISQIEQNVYIHLLNYKDDDRATILARQYHETNDKIEVVVVNYWESPNELLNYGISDESTKIVGIQSSQRSKTIQDSEFTTYDLINYTEIDLTEQKLTNAIIDVTVVKQPKVLFVTGHGEYSIDSEGGYYRIANYIGNEANEVATINLSEEELPEDCDLIVVASPESDFTKEEAEKLQSYINRGGNLMWLQDPYGPSNIEYSEAKFPNISKILGNFGISFSSGAVYESDASRTLSGMPMYVLPELSYNDIVGDIYSDGNVIFAVGGRIENVSDEKMKELGVTYEAFIKSSSTSYYKESYDTTDQEDGDEVGPFRMGEILTKKIDDSTSSTLVAYSNAIFVSNYEVQISTDSTSTISPIDMRNNKDLILNTVAYLTNKETPYRIRKTTEEVLLDNASETAVSIVVVVLLALPILIVLVGLVVVIIRKSRHR